MNNIPIEIIDLVKFLAETWVNINRYVRDNHTDDQIDTYPLVQGAGNQINLTRIGKQKYTLENVYAAIDWMLDNDGTIKNNPGPDNVSTPDDIAYTEQLEERDYQIEQIRAILHGYWYNGEAPDNLSIAPAVYALSEIEKLVNGGKIRL